ncbi:MAG: phage baseplate assembly protein V [Aquabacterium sp.]
MSNTLIERLWRRVQALISPARLTLADDSGPVQKLQLKLSQLQVTDGVPRIAEYGFVSNPPLGTDCAVLFLAGDRTNGIVVGTNNQTYRMKNLTSGEVAIHDNNGQIVHLTATGIRITSSMPVIVDAPLLHCTGSITADGDISDEGGLKTMAGMRAAHNGHHHGTSPLPDLIA